MTENNNDTPTEDNSTPVEITTFSQPIDESLTIGRLIKIKREEKNLSLKVISQQTKIHIGLLENLEADQFDKLPSKTYVRGFIKSTSKILNMDQELAHTYLIWHMLKKTLKQPTRRPTKR